MATSRLFFCAGVALATALAACTGSGTGAFVATATPVPASMTATLSSTQSTTFTVAAGGYTAILTITPSSRQDPLTVTALTAPPNGAVPLARTGTGYRPDGSTTGLTPNLYVQVVDGAVDIATSGGTEQFTAGQFSFAPSAGFPPIVYPTGPGVQFAPPPTPPATQPTFSVVGCQYTGQASNGGYTFSNLPIEAASEPTTYALLPDLSDHC